MDKKVTVIGLELFNLPMCLSKIILGYLSNIHNALQYGASGVDIVDTFKDQPSHMEWIIRHRYSYEIQLECAYHGLYKYIEQMHAVTVYTPFKPYYTDLALAALNNDRPDMIPISPTVGAYSPLEMIQWLHEKKCDVLNYDVFGMAARNGHLPVLKWLRKMAPALTVGMASACAVVMSKNLECVKYIHATGGVFISNAFTIAAKNGSIEIMAFLMAIGCPWDTPKTLQAAIEDSQYESVAWLCRRGYPIIPGHILLARKYCDENIINILHEYAQILSQFFCKN